MTNILYIQAANGAENPFDEFTVLHVQKTEATLQAVINDAAAYVFETFYYDKPMKDQRWWKLNDDFGEYRLLEREFGLDDSRCIVIPVEPMDDAEIAEVARKTADDAVDESSDWATYARQTFNLGRIWEETYDGVLELTVDPSTP